MGLELCHTFVYVSFVTHTLMHFNTFRLSISLQRARLDGT